jgi:hypothetical protein
MVIYGRNISPKSFYIPFDYCFYVRGEKEMINWIIVIIILVVVAVLFLKMNHFRHRGWIIVVVLLALFLCATLYIVNAQNKLDFTSFGGFVSSMKLYGGWLANGFHNLRSLGGNAVKMDWTSVNSNVSNNNNSVVIKTPSKTNTRLNERIK